MNFGRALRSGLPLVKAAGQYTRALMTGRRMPLYTGIFITPRCNLNCVYCFPNSPCRREEDEFSKQEIFHMVDELYAMGTRYIVLLGGEPLLREDVGDIIDYIARKKIIVEVITNGYFTRQRLAALKKVSYVCHSIDGNEADMEKNRGRGSHKKIMESLSLCRDNGIPVQMRTVFNRNNADSLDYLLTLARNWNTTLGLCEQAITREQDREFVMSAEELRLFWRRVRDYKTKGYPVDKTFRLLNNIIGFPLGIPLDRIFRRGDPLPPGYHFPPCRIARGHAFIDSNGMMYPCPMLLGRGENGRSVHGSGGVKRAWEELSGNDCLFCRQSVQDLKNEFFSYDPQAIKTVAATLLAKLTHQPG
ncbi:MAG: radical SAM protein [Thermodesulfobacteriota bacterium]